MKNDYLCITSLSVCIRIWWVKIWRALRVDRISEPAHAPELWKKMLSLILVSIGGARPGKGCNLRPFTNLVIKLWIYLCAEKINIISFPLCGLVYAPLLQPSKVASGITLGFQVRVCVCFPFVAYLMIATVGGVGCDDTWDGTSSSEVLRK